MLCQDESTIYFRILEAGAFQQTPSLEFLYLNYNNLENTITNETFKGLSRLRALYLSQTNIKQMGPSSFANLPSLQHLYIGEGALYSKNGSWKVLDGLNYRTILHVGNCRNIPASLSIKHKRIHCIAF